MSLAEPPQSMTREPTAVPDQARSGEGRGRISVIRWIGRAALALAIVGFWVEVAPRYLFGIAPLTKESIVFEYHPRLGWWHEPGKSGVFVKIDCRQRVEINSKGLREREIGYQKPPGLYRVLVLGNSVTVGFEVPAEKVLTRVMEDELARLGHPAQVINGACRGWGSDQSLIFLEEEGLKYHPDLVVYVMGGIEPTTNMELHRPYRDFGKGYFELGRDGALTLRNVPVPHYAMDAEVFLGADGQVIERKCATRQAWFLWFRDTVVCRSSACTLLLNTLMTNPALTQFLNARGAYQPKVPVGSNDFRSGLPFRLTAATFQALKGASERAGARFLICAPSVDVEFGPEVPAYFEAVGQPYWDFLKAAGDQFPRGVPLRLKHDAHYNEAGHDAVGRAMARGLIARDLVPASVRADRP